MGRWRRAQSVQCSGYEILTQESERWAQGLRGPRSVGRGGTALMALVSYNVRTQKMYVGTRLIMYKRY